MTYDLTALGFKSPQSGETVQLWTHFKALADSVQYEYDHRPAATISATVAQSVANNVTTNLQYDTAVGDPASYDLTNDRLLCPRDGLYRVEALVSWVASGTGLRQQGITYHPSAGGGDAYVGMNNNVASSATNQAFPVVSKLVPCVAGDYFYMRVLQTNGAALNTYVGLLGVWLSHQWVRPL